MKEVNMIKKRNLELLAFGKAGVFRESVYVTENKNFKIPKVFSNVERDKLYKLVWSGETEFDNENGIIYINSLDELLSITGSNKLPLFYLDDLLVKLKLNTEITITNLYFDDDYDIEGAYTVPDNDNAKQIKIGYIYKESKMYNKDLAVYEENIKILLEVIMFCLNLSLIIQMKKLKKI